MPTYTLNHDFRPEQLMSWDRVPAIHFPKSNQLYVGQLGWTHGNVYTAARMHPSWLPDKAERGRPQEWAYWPHENEWRAMSGNYPGMETTIPLFAEYGDIPVQTQQTPKADDSGWDAYLAAALLPEVRFTFEHFAAILHEAAWTDVANKAKRLVQEGRVTILRNAPHHIMAHVIGDGTDNNGTPDEHDVEISRELDAQGMPTSNTIQQWHCSCRWADFSWDRTRKWKKFEGRPCSHVIATYWKARSTPLDVTDMPEGFQVPRGQKQSPAGPGQMGIPGIHPTPETPKPEDFMPKPPGAPGEAEATPGTPPPSTTLPSNTDLTLPKAPESPFSVPKQQPDQREQMQLFDITAPPGQPGQQMQLPIVSVPGGSPPTPGNPVKFPGTFSHFIPVLAVYTDRFIYANDALSEYFEQQKTAKQPITVALLNAVALERSGGKIPIPGAQPYSVSSEGIPLYNVMDLGWNPNTQKRENADVNVLQGAPEQTGTYSDVMPGKYAEVVDYEPNLKMAYIIVPLNYGSGIDCRLHPHLLRGWVSYSDIRPVQGISKPFRYKK